MVLKIDRWWFITHVCVTTQIEGDKLLFVYNLDTIQSRFIELSKANGILLLQAYVCGMEIDLLWPLFDGTYSKHHGTLECVSNQCGTSIVLAYKYIAYRDRQDSSPRWKIRILNTHAATADQDLGTFEFSGHQQQSYHVTATTYTLSIVLQCVAEQRYKFKVEFDTWVSRPNHLNVFQN